MTENEIPSLTITLDMIKQAYALGSRINVSPNLTKDQRDASVIIFGLSQLLKSYSIQPNFKLSKQEVYGDKEEKHKFFTD